MRKFLKNGILEICQTMYEAHRNIKSLIEKKDFDCANIVLGDCQDTAIQLGEIIENSEGEGFVTVSFLEEYCEEIYNVSTSINENYNANKAQKSLDKILVKIENSVKNDIKVQLEIVFLPYKASMFDSLESIWRAADNDPDCNAHVIPIPYYDRKPDGSFGEMHYEGAEYPEYVPVVHYEAYNLELMKPDIIYFHNPYDGNNFVTSVDPRFYSYNLKKHTDKLVYVPYFVLAELNPNDEKTLENIAHFVIAPGVINADEVIVQSEAMKQAYVNILLKHTGDNAQTRAYLNNKIKGTGSPKFDKIANTTKENISIPEEWNKYLYKPDGSMKKVIFYNNSISAFLENDERMIKKIRSVLDIFYNNKDEVALLWRPHPLIKATIESMRPHLWESYNAIVHKYIADDWGIYDDTADLDRAIALSDGYYGDPSSVTSLFKKVDKLVFIQSINPEPHKSHIPSLPRSFNNIYFFDAYMENDTMIVSNITYNALFKINLTTRKSCFIDCFKAEPDNKILHNKIIPYKNSLVFIPEGAANISIYHLESCSMEQIPVPNQDMRAVDSFLYDSCIYIFPKRLSDDVLMLDLNKRLIKSGVKLSDYIDAGLNNSSAGKAVLIDDNVWLPVQNTNIIIQYNIGSGNVNRLFIDKKYKLNHIEYDGSFLWATLMNKSKIIKIHPKNGSVDEFIINDGGDTEKPLFNKVVHLCDEQYLVLPAYSENIILIKNNEAKIIPYPSDFSWADDFKSGWSRMLYYKRVQNQIYIFPSVSNMLLIYDIDLEKLFGFEIAAPDDWDIEYIYQNFLFPQYKERFLNNNGELKESQYWDLNNFITAIRNKTNNTVAVNEKCGKLIHNIMINNLIERN